METSPCLNGKPILPIDVVKDHPQWWESDDATLELLDEFFDHHKLFINRVRTMSSTPLPNLADLEQAIKDSETHKKKGDKDQRLRINFVKIWLKWSTYSKTDTYYERGKELLDRIVEKAEKVEKDEDFKPLYNWAVLLTEIPKKYEGCDPKHLSSVKNKTDIPQTMLDVYGEVKRKIRKDQGYASD